MIDAGEVSTVGAYTFLILVLSNLFSILLLGEKANFSLLVGLLMIAGSIVLVNRRKMPGPITTISSNSGSCSD